MQVNTRAHFRLKPMTTGDLSTQQLLAQEERFIFESFTNEDAISLGQQLLNIALPQKAPVIIQVRIGELTIFHTALTGSSSKNEWWINRKCPVVEKFGHSSINVRVMFEEKDQTFEEHSGLEEELYAAHGGAFPIVVRNQGRVGIVAVSGLPQVQDHELIIEGLTRFSELNSKK